MRRCDGRYDTCLAEGRAKGSDLVSAVLNTVHDAEAHLADSKQKACTRRMPIPPHTPRVGDCAAHAVAWRRWPQSDRNDGVLVHASAIPGRGMLTRHHSTGGLRAVLEWPCRSWASSGFLSQAAAAADVLADAKLRLREAQPPGCGAEAPTQARLTSHPGTDGHCFVRRGVGGERGTWRRGAGSTRVTVMSQGLAIAIRELDDVLMRDVGGRIKHDGRCACGSPSRVGNAELDWQ